MHRIWYDRYARAVQEDWSVRSGQHLRWGLGLSALLWTAPAAAQDLFEGSLDGHGPVLTPSEGDPDDLLWVWTPGEQTRGTFAVVAQGELAARPLVQDLYADGEFVRSNELVGALGGVNLSLNYAFTNWAQVAVSVPFWPLTLSDDGNQVSLGDTRLSVPLSLLRGKDGGGFTLGVMPFVDLATNVGSEFVSGGFGGGARLAAGFGPRNLRFSADLGGGYSGNATYAGLSGLRLQAGAGVAWMPVDAFGVRLEAYGAMLGAQDGISPPALPAETALSLRYRLDNGLAFTLGGATALTGGPGAAVARGFLGVSFTNRPRTQAAPVVAEAQPSWVLVLADEDGNPIEDGVVFAGDQVLAWTDYQGRALLEEVPPDTTVRVEGDGFEPVEVVLSGDPGEAVRVGVALLPCRVRLRVTDNEGRPVQARVLWSGPEDVAPATTEGGLFETELADGAWEVLVSAPELGVQQRTVTIEPGDVRRYVDVVLGGDEGGDANLTVRVTGPDGPLEGAEVLVDGQSYGRTGSGGALTLENLRGGQRTVLVRKEAHSQLEAALSLRPGSQEHTATLELLPGAVQVRVADTRGEPIDATVRFLGPEPARPGRLGFDGAGLFTLAAGEWSLLVSSPSFGLQQREVTIEADQLVMVDVKVVLLAGEDGSGSLVVRVVDPDGQPVPDAAVLVDGEEVGATSSGGSVRLDELRLGRRLVQVRSAHHRAVEPVTLDLTEGLQERLFAMVWREGTVRVRAREQSGAPVPGTARFLGDAPVPPLALDSRGEGWLHLDPGTWEVLVAAPELGAAQREVEVGTDPTRLSKVEVVLGQPVDGAAELDLTVSDPDGEPVDQARVLVDGRNQGTTVDGRAKLTELLPGRRELTVLAPAHQTIDAELDLAVGAQAHTLVLPWGGGAVKAVVTGPDGTPLDAQVRWIGPDLVPPTRLGPDGERVFTLAPGSWSGLATMAEYGLQQQDIEVVGNERDPVEVRFTLGEQPRGATDLLVRVVDPDGLPVPGAEVLVGGKPAGRTPDGGFVIADDVRRATTNIQVRAEAFEQRAIDGVALSGGVQEQWVTLPWVPIQLPVRATDSQGAPVDATVQLDGPRNTRMEGRLGSDGVEVFEVRPGAWRVVISSEKLGTQHQEVQVALGEQAPEVAMTLASQKVVKTDAEFRILEKVQFKTDSADIGSASDALLAEVAASLLANPQVMKVEVAGHTDTRGTAEHNKELSQRRAESVLERLVALGVERWRLDAVGYGDTRPLASNNTQSGQATNRRVQFSILEVEVSE